MENTEDKFLEIYEKNKNLVLKTAYDMTGDYHLAQDICQETFLKLLGFQDYADEKRIKSWLVVVAMNLVRDRKRKGGKYKEILNLQEELKDTADARNNVDRYLEQLGQREFKDHILMELYKKKPIWYEVFMLAEYLEVPRKQIAKKYNVSLSSIDSYLKKSKRWLKDNFEKEYREL